MNARFMALALLVAGAVSIGGAAGESSAKAMSGSPDAYIAAWDAIGTQAFVLSGLGTGDGHILFAYEGIAVYDAVTAIEGGQEPFAVDVDAAHGALAEAAVVAAAHAVLVHYLPDQSVMLDSAYEDSIASITPGQARSDGIEVGELVAARLIELRAHDGFLAPYTYTAPNPPIPGVWIPTATTPAAGTYLPHMTPFSLGSPDQFRPGGPPALSSREWARDYNEVKEIGSATSTSRTAEQTETARFWAEPPIPQTHGALRNFVLGRELDVADAARFMAMVDVVLADGNIACFDAKYHYAFWRPITAIPVGDTDGNDDTAADPAWKPLIATPNHPEYPSAHACLTPAIGRVIARFLGTDQIDYTVPSVAGRAPHHFETVQDLEYEVGNARIWGGIHYRTSVEDGNKIGTKTVHQVLAHHFHETTP
jgi:hypothetical protein